MRTSITRGGHALTVEEMRYLARALREDRDKYRECHGRIKELEGRRLMMLPDE